MNTADIGNGGSWAWDQLESRSLGRLVVDEEVVVHPHGEHETEDSSSNEPLVCEEGGRSRLGLEEGVGGNVVGGHIGINLGHDDRWGDGSRHLSGCWLSVKAAAILRMEERMKGKTTVSDKKSSSKDTESR